MKRLEYKTPEIEVINVEVEGMIALSGDEPSNFSKPSVELSNSSSSVSSYSMDSYNWK